MPKFRWLERVLLFGGVFLISTYVGNRFYSAIYAQTALQRFWAAQDSAKAQSGSTTTPLVVTTVETVSGKVWQVTPPLSVILTLENGENQRFRIPEGQKFMVDGQETDAWGLKKGMNVTATRITETPFTNTTTGTHIAGTLPPDGAILVATGKPKPVPAAAGTKGAEGTTGRPAETTTTASNQLPKTAGDWPLIGLLGLMSIASSLVLRLLRMKE